MRVSARGQTSNPMNDPLDSSVPLDCRRADFSLPQRQHYLNCAYMGPMPRVVEEEGIRALRLKGSPSRIEGADFFSPSAALRARFADLIHAPDPERIAIHPSVSYGVATAARNITLSAEQNIVLLHEQFPGNVYAWRRRAAESGAELRTVRPPPSVPRGVAWSERVLDAIDRATGVVAVPTVHWTDGTRMDLLAISARAREVGAALVVDGTQSVGAVDFDVQAIRPDALIVAGYKWLLGPYSMALSYLGERFSGGVPLEETWIGRKHSEDFKGLVDYEDEYQPGSLRFDVGEYSNFILVPMLRRALDILIDWNPDRISAYCSDLSSPLIQRAIELGFSVEEDAWRSPHLFGLYMPEGLELSALKAALEEREIFVSLRGQALRVSPNVYNEERDVDALIEALVVARGQEKLSRLSGRPCIIRAMIDQQLLTILVCPETHQPVRPADAGLLASVNKAIESGGLLNRAGVPVSSPLEDALVREDGRVLYPVREDIPIMLIDECIDWELSTTDDSEE
jgi:selenocysteine lyase/cysteine desulfurase/uncharacterized protein YbaR (Trm112 family)